MGLPPQCGSRLVVGRRGLIHTGNAGSNPVCRLMKLTLLTTIVLLFASSTAFAVDLTVPLPRGSITVIHADCPDVDALGCLWDETTIYVSIPDRYVLEHERAHIFDLRNLDDGERNAISRKLHKMHMPWCDLEAYEAQPESTPENSPPCEDFADAYANCRLRTMPFTEQWVGSFYGYDPSPRQHRRMCALIRRAAD